MATYTTIDEIDLAAVARRYRLCDLMLEPLDGGLANSSFTVRAREGHFVLTALDNHDFASARLLAQLTQSLHDNSFPTNSVVPDCDGNAVIEVNGKPAILKRWIAGETLDVLPAGLLFSAGEHLARLHEMPASLPGLPRRTRRLSERHRAKIDTFADRGFAMWLTDRLHRLHPRVSAASSVAVIHGDLYPDNVVITPGHTLALIDWETASLDDPLLDLGMTIVGLGSVCGELVADRATRIIAGYTWLRPLSGEQLELLASMTEYAALVIAYHRFYRHNLRYPKSVQDNRYKEIVSLVDTLDRLAL